MNDEFSIRQFTDYRVFLSAHAQEMRQRHPKWSFGVWANRIGLRDTSSITKIINGDREAGDQITSQLISYFKFNKNDADYFRDLVRLSKIRKDPRLSVMLLTQMAKRDPLESSRLLDEKTFAVISNWFYLPLREATRLPHFSENSEWISENLNFKISAREFKQALDTLLELGLLKRNRSGKLAVSEGEIRTTNDLSVEAIKRFHEQMLQRAQEAVRTIAVEDREFQSESLCIDPKNLELAKEMIREFRERFSRTFEERSGGAVFQFQMQLFPITRIQRDPKS